MEKVSLYVTCFPKSLKLNICRLWVFGIDYDAPVKHFMQLINEDKRGNPYYQEFISNTNNSIQLSWEYVHYYHGYELYWWTDMSGKNKIFIQPSVLEKTRFHEIEYYSFVDNTPDVFVYYFQIQGWLYGRGNGMKSQVLKALKPYKGQSFPVISLKQLPNEQNASIYLEWLNPTLFHYEYQIVYWFLSNGSGTTVVEFLTNSTAVYIDNVKQQPNKKYKVFVYPYHNNQVKDNLARHQAKPITVRTWYRGQASEPRNLSQIRSRHINSISVVFSSLSGFELGEVHLHYNCYSTSYCLRSYTVVVRNLYNDSIIKSQTCPVCGLNNCYYSRKSTVCEVIDLPLTNETFRVGVYGVTEYGPGYQAIMYAKPNQTILTGLPKQVTELMVWNAFSIFYISIRFRYLDVENYDEKEIGLFKILFYQVTISSQRRYKRIHKTKHYNEIDNSTKMYNISVCAMTMFGCGQPAELKNIKTGRYVQVVPRIPGKIQQRPSSLNNKIILSWSLDVHDMPKQLPTIGFQVKLACAIPTIATRYSELKINDIRKKNLVGHGGYHYFEESFSVDCTTVFVSIRAYNSFTYGKYGEVVSAKAGFVGLSVPTSLVVEDCTNDIKLYWTDIPETKSGYCVKYRYRGRNKWHSCCSNAHRGRNFAYDVISQKAIVRFTQKFIRRGEQITSVLCEPPTPGDLQFQVSAYNSYGNGYEKRTDFHECGVPKSDKQSRESKTSNLLTLPLILGLTLAVLVLLGIFVWRIRRRLGNQQRAFHQPAERVVNEVVLIPSRITPPSEDVEMMLLSNYKLPNYDEAITDTRNDPPPYFEDENENVA